MYHLAIDIGASSGRHILGWLENGRLQLEEIHRFDNGFHEQDGNLVWDTEHLFQEVKAGIAKCKDLGKIPATVAIDTWGVDYLLLDENKKELMPAVSYRDERTVQGVEEVGKFLPQSVLYARNGIQKQTYNTLYQLYCDRRSGKLQKAKYFLMLPEYLFFKLTGVIKNEYTNATTTNLVHAESKEWDRELLNTLEIPETLFQPLSLPGTEVGGFTKEVEAEIGFNAKVVLCPSHDTASAVAACPVDERCVYLSSGTWSLIGTENLKPVLDEAALNANFTNEGGVDYRFCFLKNIMGMWLFQSIRKNLDKKYTYDEMMQMAMSSDFTEKIDPTHPSFLAPESMIEAVRTYLGKPDLPLADVLSSVYHSLAAAYDKAVREIETISGKEIEAIYIVGGGSKDAYLNRLTAQYTGKKVYIGLMEATATGNLLSQMMVTEQKSLAEMREIIRTTFQIRAV